MNNVASKAYPDGAWLQDLTELVRLASQRRGLTLATLTEDVADRLASLRRGREAVAEMDPATRLPARPLLERLAALFAGGPHRIAVDCDPALELPVRELAPLGIIVCEAITNAVKHAFPMGREGSIWIRLAADGDRRRLTVRDSGLGISDLPGELTGGAWLIEALAHGLGGYARLGSAQFGGGLVTVVYPATT